MKSSIEIRQTKKFIIFIIFLVVAIASLPVFKYLDSFGNRQLSLDPEQWGQLGDYIGGLINPIIGFATLISVLYAIFLQKIELSETKSALIEQSQLMDEQLFDGKFFNMLSLFNESVNSMRIKIDGNEYHGFEAIKESLNELIVKSSDLSPRYVDSADLRGDVFAIIGGYTNLYLGSTTMFMTIQRILRIESVISESSAKDKQHYHHLFTVFLSEEIKIWVYIFFVFTKNEGKIPPDYGCLGIFLNYFTNDLAVRLDIPLEDLGKVSGAIQSLVRENNQ